MGWTILLEDESGIVVKSISKEYEIWDFTNRDFAGTTLLKYLDQYGDTVFNRLQIKTLLNDLNSTTAYSNYNDLKEEFRELHEEMISQPHLYFRFCGD